MASLAEVYPCMPSLERGRGILVDGDVKSSSIIYCNGRSVIIRSLLDPLKVDVYCQHAYPATVARFSPNGEWVASADVSGTVRIWGSSGEHVLRHEYRVLSGRIDDLQWSPDGERIVVCGDGKGKSFVRAIMWNTGTSVGEFDGSSKRVLSCAFKPSRPFRIATGGEDFLVNFYEGPPFKFKASHREHGNFVNCVRFSPDGSKFISVGSDRKMIVYDGKTGEKISVVSSECGHTGSIYAISWNSKGSQVLTVSADKTAKIWNVSADGSTSLHSTYSFASDSRAEAMQVGCLWLKDYLITFSLSGAMNFLAAEHTGPPEKVLSGHTKSITAVSASDVNIYSSSYDGVVIRWKVGVGFIEVLENSGLAGFTQGLSVCGETVVASGQTKLLKLAGGESEMFDMGATCTSFSVASKVSEIVFASTEDEVFLLKNFTVVSKLKLPYVSTAVAISPDATLAVVGSKDGKLHVYSITGDLVAEEAVLEQHRAAVTTVEFNPDGSLFASGDQNREALVWDSITREVKMKNMLYHTARISCIAWAMDSSSVATGSVDGCIYIYNIHKPASGKLSIKGAHAGGVTGLAFTSCGKLVSGGSDACLRLWNVS